MIEVHGLVKEFGAVRAVDSISFSVPKGQILGFLGPNGAGKSTTMKMITGFLEPTSGSAQVGGMDIIKNPIEVKKLIGYLPENAPSYGEMTVCEFLQFIAEMRGLKDRDAAVLKMREVCNLQTAWHQSIETLSKGYKQRVGFAQALIHDPPVLILDEPTDGLDPNQKHEVRELIKKMGKDKTIIISTHILEEVEAICERVVIISEGVIAADATPAKLMEKSSLHNAVTVKLAKSIDKGVEHDLSRIEGVERVEVLDDGVLRFYPENGRSIINDISSAIGQKNLTIEQINIEKGRFDEVFRKITLEGLRTEA